MEVRIAEMETERKKKAKFNPNVDQKRKLRMITVPERVMRIRETLVLTGKKGYGRLAIGDYQRTEVKDWVGDLKDAIKRGSMPPPIDVVVRTWETDPGKKDLLWIVDGQQRALALSDSDAPIIAQVHWVESDEEERNLFLIYNQRRKLGPTTTIAAHTGPSAELIRKVAADEQHPLYDRILVANYDGSKTKLQPATVLSAITVILGAETHNVSTSLATVDRMLAGNRDRVDTFLVDLSSIIPNGHKPTTDIVFAFARFWADNGPLTKKARASIARMKLDNVTGTTTSDRRAAIRQRLERALAK